LTLLAQVDRQGPARRPLLHAAAVLVRRWLRAKVSVSCQALAVLGWSTLIGRFSSRPTLRKGATSGNRSCSHAGGG
jgi:hypothetical protein